MAGLRVAAWWLVRTKLRTQVGISTWLTVVIVVVVSFATLRARASVGRAAIAVGIGTGIGVLSLAWAGSMGRTLARLCALATL